MSTKCKVDSCEREAAKGRKGWCLRHYKRWCKYGDPEQGYYYNEHHLTLSAFVEKALVCTSDKCLEWPFNTAGGYGLISYNGSKGILVHRYVLEKVSGPPPEEWYHAAHNCGNKLCVNPNHLRWATPSENMQDKWKHGVYDV